jgi:signal transduction histidine kinase
MYGTTRPVYCGDVTSRAVLSSTLGALLAERTWRATLHAFTGLLLAGITLLLITLWTSAVLSLADGPTGAPVLAVIYVVGAVAGVIPLLWWLSVQSAVQRARFLAVLGVEILAPPGARGRWPVRLLRAWQLPATWRQLGYHLAALIIGPIGGGLVAACWSGMLIAVVYPGPVPGGRPAAIAAGAAALLAAPWVARAIAWADEAAGRSLLGPGRAQELTRRVEALARSRAELVAAADQERRRIERDLHDGAQQRLVALAMNLGMTLATLGDVPESIRLAIEQSHEQALAALAELRELVRGLHPAVLNDRGLDAALSGLVARAPHRVRLHVDVATRCAPGIEAIAYFTVCEALANVTKHARATHVEVTVRRSGDRLRVTVTDDGCGGASLDGDGSGLRGLAQRAGTVDGWLCVDSPAGGPTTITVELPCAS